MTGWWTRADRVGAGWALDLIVYGLSAAFALLTAFTSTLAAHRAWGRAAVWGYAIGALVAGTGLIRRHASVRLRWWVTGGVWLTTTVVPLIWLAVARAGGRTDRAQEEVIVIEQGGHRLLDQGTPYLSRVAISALPAGERLLGYLPYQPGMAAFGLPRAAAAGWWTDARVWFLLATTAALLAALALLHRAGHHGLVRAAQVATVLPLCALTLATGGDDLPVLALCLLACALVATGRWGGAGLAVGLAGALKLFAWPVAVVLLVAAIVARRGPRFAVGAIGIPVLALLPALLIDPGAVVENVIRYPSGHGLVSSPAQSPLLGAVIAAHVPGGRGIALALLGATAVAIGWWLVAQPPRSAADAAVVIAWGLLWAVVLMPTTRFGYLLYPAAFAVWVPALRPEMATSGGDP